MCMYLCDVVILILVLIPDVCNYWASKHLHPRLLSLTTPSFNP